MNGPDAGAGIPAAVPLLEQERRMTALEAGEDLWLDDATTGEQLAVLQRPLSTATDRVGLVLIPDTGHPLGQLATRPGQALPAMTLTPDMSESERRDLGTRLRNQAVQLLFFTPERLTQPRFVQFMRGQNLAYVAVASCQRISGDCREYFPPYEACRALRALIPGVPVAALFDGQQSTEIRIQIALALGIQRVPKTADLPEPAQPAPSPPNTPPRTPPLSEALRAAFPLFEQGLMVEEAARTLGRDVSWTWQALATFIRHTGRTHPFPWVDKPTYLRVSMAAGQAETTEPRLIKSFLRGTVEERLVTLVLAALENRNRQQ